MFDNNHKYLTNIIQPNYRIYMSITMWGDIDWVKVNTSITKIQKRIYQATIDNKIGVVHYLQRKLINSKYAKLLSVRQVTQINNQQKI